MEDERCSASFYWNIFSFSLGNADALVSKFPTELKAAISVSRLVIPSKRHLSPWFYSPCHCSPNRSED